jgi:hypothetical protein
MNKKEHWTTLGVALLAGFIGGTLSGRFVVGDAGMAQEPPKHAKVIEAEEFRVVDRNAQVRVLLGVGPDGSATVAFTDKASKASALFGLEANGTPRIALVDKNAQTRASLTLDADGSPELAFRDEHAREQARFGLGTQGGPSLLLMDKSMVGGTALGVGADGNPALALWGRDGKSKALFLPGLTGFGLYLSDNNGQSRVFLGSTDDGKATVTLRDKDGKTIWSAP